MKNGNADLFEIVYLKNKDIDKAKWDRCISNAANGLVYATSFYLYALAKKWDAIIINNYEWVMPLPFKIKYGIRYLFQPGLTPTLGLFGDHPTPALVSLALKAIPGKFKLWDISMNHSNLVSSEYPAITRNNYVLDLNHDHSVLKNGYTTNCRRNITKAQKLPCVIRTGIPIEDIIVLSKKQFKTFTSFKAENFISLKDIFLHYDKKQQAKSYGVYNEKNKLVGSCVFLFFNKRAYYWLVGNDKESKDYNASFLLVDQFIKDHAGKDLRLDFEGSQNSNIAKFYQGFGAVNEPYTTIYLNKLPGMVKFFKPDPYK